MSNNPIQVQLLAPPHYRNAGSVWGTLATASGATTLTLSQAYPKLKPAIGWQVQHGAVRYEVIGVSGLMLAIAALAPPAPAPAQHPE